MAAENTAAFLAELGNLLKVARDADSELAEIISEKILTTAPDEDCVRQALLSITALAELRARPSKDEANVESTVHA